jgi:hypothetical protein
MQRRQLSELTVIAVSLVALLGATSAVATPSAGTASTSMTAVQATVEGLGPIPPVSVLDILTYASTDGDPARNERGASGPFTREVLGLLPQIAGTDLLEIDAFDVGTSAVATSDLATSKASFLCSSLTVRVLGQESSTPSCSAGVDTATAAARTIEGSLGRVDALLRALPLQSPVALDALHLDLFPNIDDDVRRDGDYLDAVASGSGTTVLDHRPVRGEFTAPAAGPARHRRTGPELPRRCGRSGHLSGVLGTLGRPARPSPPPVDCPRRCRR